MGLDVLITFFKWKLQFFRSQARCVNVHTEPTGLPKEQQNVLSLQAGVVGYLHADHPPRWAELPPPTGAQDFISL